MKQKPDYVKSNNLLKKLNKKQKQYLINKYIYEIEIDYDKNYNVSIRNIVFNKNESENIDYMFRSDCFDMIVSTHEIDIILFTYTKEKDINRYVDTLRSFYNIKVTIIQADSFDITELNTDDVIQIIPQEKSSM